MKKTYLLSICCAVLSLSGCDHYSTKLASVGASPQNIADISPAAGGEMTFSQYLASEYYQLARYEQDQRYNYKVAKYYTEKAEKLSKGQMVSPASLDDFDVKAEKAEELVQARRELIDALHTYNIPENRYSLAMAQTRYDCWVEQQNQNRKNNNAQTCKNEFKHAISSLVPPDHKEIKIMVPFSAGSMVLSEDARISLGRVLSFWKNNEQRGYQLSLSPAADRPKEEVERQLSMVRSILQYNGIPASKISVMESEQNKDDFEVILIRNESQKEQSAI